MIPVASLRREGMGERTVADLRVTRTPISRLGTFRLFLRERRDPEPFHTAIAAQLVDSLRVPLAGTRVLDLGCGPGFYSRALAEKGATVVSSDIDATALHSAQISLRALIADGTRLPFADAVFGGVLCSNVLEHTPSPESIITEITRILQPGGWAWISWTNWYSPWGGHAITPLHYLGPRLGVRAWRALLGEPRGKNLPFTNLWPTYIGTILADVRHRPDVRLVDAMPRYYPSQRWILRVPGLREVATWNCVLVLEKRDPSVGHG